HTGGVAGGDITQGLPRVEELFEARKPKGLAIISEFGGTVSIADNKQSREVIVTDDETGESKVYPIPYGSRIKVTDGKSIEAGDELTEGSVNPHDLLKIKGIRAVQNYLLQEVQRVYRLQGVDICDKHIEVIVRQMLKKIRIENSGDTSFLPGSLVDVLEFEEENERLIQQARTPAEGKQVILGITKAALATNSFLSAASFQETTKVLTDAAIHGRVDPLIGLKENVIIGKLIPAGTGMKRYHSTRLSTDAKIRMKQARAQQDMEDERVTPEMFDSMTAGQGGTDEAPASADAVPEGETSGTASDFIPGDMDQEQTDDGYFEDIEDITDEEPDHDEDDAFDSEDIIVEEDD
ncbi:MAG: DNA-directed RNA polymerase subunit beta', partial [Lachnospiraceae bacterium]|nr:DNA-directed RNA polymerase subunit beta' [Lachnospiraceae bacterium]